MGRFVQGSGYDLIFSSDLGGIWGIYVRFETFVVVETWVEWDAGLRQVRVAPGPHLPPRQSICPIPSQKILPAIVPSCVFPPNHHQKSPPFETSTMTTPAIQTPSVQTPPIPQGAGSATVPSILPLRSAGQKDGNSLGTFNVSCTPAYMKIAYLITFVGEIGFGTDVEGVLDGLRLCISRSVLK